MHQKMKPKILFLFLLPALALVVSSKVYAQSFYVLPTEKGFESKITDKIRSEGYKLAANESGADYKVECIVTGEYKALALKNSFQGYVRITDRTTGKEVAKTEQVGRTPSVYNGFNAGPAIMEKIAKKYLTEALDKAVADYRKKPSSK